jgi:hypothetical protein
MVLGLKTSYHEYILKKFLRGNFWMATTPEQPRTKLVQSLCRSFSQWPPLQLAALVGFGLIPFVTMPQLSHELAADAASTTINSPAQTRLPAEYRAWNQSTAWKPQISSFFWDRPNCKSDQTCLPVKVLTRDDCEILSVSASTVNPTTGQNLLTTAKMKNVEAGQEQNLTLRWNMPPAQANGILAREATRKTQIETLGDHQGNSSLQELAMARVRAKLIPAPHAWQAVTIQEIHCL